MDGRFAMISTEARLLLRKGGFSSVREALKSSPTDLAKELGIELPEAIKLLAELRGENAKTNRAPPTVRNALEMVQTLQTTSVRYVTTCCRPLDKILMGGFARGQLTEICGAPGAGKTQLCIQVAVCASIPEYCGGLEGETVYLDTEGSFSPQRAFDMSDALASHLSQQRTEGDPNYAVPSQDEMMQNIHVCRAHDYGEQLAFVQCLPMFLRAHPKVRVVIVDSVAHHFRHDFADMSQRSKLLSRHAHALNAVAQDFDVVVLVTNHMTTRIDQGLVPALGEHWYHGVTNRVILRNTGEMVDWVHPRRKEAPPIRVPLRQAEIVKAASLQNASADFVVVNIGIRPPKANRPSQPTSTGSSWSATAVEDGNDDNAKRIRQT